MKLPRVFKIFLILIATIVVLYIGFVFYDYYSGVTVTVDYPEPEQIKYVPESAARKVVEDNLNFFESWRDNRIGKSTLFRDMEQTRSAYLFEIDDYQGKAGYMVISATTRFEPVITISKDALNPVGVAYLKMKEIADTTVWDVSDIRSEYIYIGGNEYFARFVFRDGDEITVKYYKLDKNLAIEVEEDELLQKQEQYINETQEGAETLWAKYFAN